MTAAGPRARARLAALARTCREPWARVCIVLVGVLCAAALSGLRVNVSRSYPVGLYRVVGGAADVERGSVVIVCLPPEWARFARERGILGPGHCEGGTYGLGKMVLAVAGDVVEVRREGITVNGVAIPRSRTLDQDSRERPMPHHPWGRYALRLGEVWLFSPYHPGAFDSRYFGPVSTTCVQAVVRPVWTDRRDSTVQSDPPQPRVGEQNTRLVSLMFSRLSRSPKWKLARVCLTDGIWCMQAHGTH